MLIGAQLVGIIFGLFMLYFTNLYYRRKEFSLGDYLFWNILWIGFLSSTIFPASLNILLETLQIRGAMHFFTIAGFLLMFLLVFFMYKTVKRTQKRTELIVKHLASQYKKK